MTKTNFGGQNLEKERNRANTFDMGSKYQVIKELIHIAKDRSNFRNIVAKIY